MRSEAGLYLLPNADGRIECENSSGDPSFCRLVPLRPSIAQSIPCADVALVLAIDGSGSISDIEFFFQLDATGQALRDPAVVGRMQSVGGVAVAAVL